MSRNLVIQEHELQAEREDRAGHQKQPGHLQYTRRQPLHHSLSTKVLWVLCAIAVLIGLSLFLGAAGTDNVDQVTMFAIGGGLLMTGVAAGFVAYDRKLVSAQDAGPFASHPLALSSGSSLRRSSAKHRGVTHPGLHAAVLAVLFAASIVLVVWAMSSDEQSAYTQSHGVSDVASIDSYANDTSCSHSSCETTFTAEVALSSPVSGHRFTTVQGDGSFAYSDGQRIAVLVDPRDPGFAELPGNDDNSGEFLLISLIISGVLGVLTIAAVLRLVHILPDVAPSRHTATR